MKRVILFASCALTVGWIASCGGSSNDDGATSSSTAASSSGAGGSGASGSGGSAGANATEVVFDLSADTTNPAHFYDRPFPSDARVTSKGAPDYTGFTQKPKVPLVDQLVAAAPDHVGAPTMGAAYFEFTAPIAPQDVDTTIAADPKSPVLFVDVENQALLPSIASTLPADPYVPDDLLVVAPRPGFVLLPKHTYAAVVMTSIQDANGKELGVAKTMSDLAAGKGSQASLYAPLFKALDALKIDRAKVAAATVFTTGDVVQDLFDISSGLLAKYSITIDGLTFDADNAALQDRYCALEGTITMPQFQKGKPPFDTDGLFDFSDGGLPAKQGDATVPITIALPRSPMPDAGYPLVLFFHGSGGYSSQVIDRGTWYVTNDASQCPQMMLEDWNGTKGCNKKAEGPAYVLAPFGFGAAGAALPVNPERLPGASETAYLNISNIVMGRDLFRQGVIEQRLILAALSKLTIDPALVSACSGVSLPPGQTAYKYDPKHLYAQGQSMGGQYANMVSAVEPDILGVVPTGAGGYWSYFAVHTSLMGGLAGPLGLVLGTTQKLNHLHPALQLFETIWEPVDPMVYMPRVARRPLSGHPARPIYEPVGQGDSYFPEQTYDAASLAYGHKEAGTIVWSSMQDALKLQGLDGIAPYSVKNDLMSSNGTTYTGAIMQYVGDGIYDPHSIFTQLDSVKYQYGCFLSTLLQNGVATIPAPQPLGTPCPND